MKEQQNENRNGSGGIEMQTSDQQGNVLRESCKTNSNSSSTCERHESVLVYCTECTYIVCGQCEKKHALHHQLKLSDASKLTKGRMNIETTQVKNLIRYANIVIKDLHIYLEKLSASLTDITNQVLQRSAGAPEEHDLLTDSLLNDVQTENDTETNRIRNKITEFDEFIASAKNKVVSFENLMNAVDDTYVITKGNCLLKGTSSLMASLPNCPKERCMYVISPLSPQSDGKEHTTEELVGQLSKIKVPWRIEVKRTGSFRPDSVSSRFVTTMCPADDELVWVVWQWGPGIQLVDKEGTVKETVDVGCKVDDICTHNDTLIVSSHESKSIKILDKNHEIIQTINTEKVPRGVYPVSSKELIVCCVENLHHRKGDTSSLLRVNINSGTVQELPCSEHLIQPWRVAVNVNGDICVSDRNKGCVLIFDIEGNLKASYSGPDTSTRHPFAPHAICCDRYGQIFVVDYTNHTVHVLDPMGRFRGFLIMDTELEKRAIFMGTSSPFSVTIDSVGDVWVGNKFGYLTVLHYNK